MNLKINSTEVFKKISLEDYLISLSKKKFPTSSDLVGIGDDCAFLKKENLLISSDSFVENRHFNRNFMSPSDISQKFITSNYSDIQSCAGKPEYCLLNLSFPKRDSDYAKLLIKNIHRVLKKNKINLIGGDTTASNKEIFLNLTIFGQPVKKPIFRKAKINQLICTIQGLGYSQIG